MKTRQWLVVTVLSFGSLVSGAAEFVPEVAYVETLPQRHAHWFWVSDYTRTALLDGDSGQFLGSLTPGHMQKVDLPRSGEALYVAESYYSRHVRGERTDVVSIYDPRTLEAVDEVVIPPKRYDGSAFLGVSGLSGDQRFLLVANLTPAQSVSVVDLQARRFVAEIPTPGCAVILPHGSRGFSLLCGDGTLLTITLDAGGIEQGRERSVRFFSPHDDPLMEKAVRRGDRWHFISFESYVHEVDFADGSAAIGERWSLVSPEERVARWRVGGYQPLALHSESGLLYALLHQGGKDSHKQPGEEIWVCDLSTRERIARRALAQPVSSLQVTQDEQPLLITARSEGGVLDVYAAHSGLYLRSIEEMHGSVIQTYPRAGAGGGQ